MKLLMITGDRALAAGKQGAFYNTLEEFHKHWDRVDIICPKVTNHKQPTTNNLFGNVFIHPSPWPLIFQPLWIWYKGRQIFRRTPFDVFTCNDYPPFYNGIGAWALRLAAHVPYVLEIMHIPGYPHPANFKEKAYRWMARWLVRYDAMPARAVRVINQRQVPEFLIKAGISKDKLLYIPAFYIDLDVFSPQDSHKEYDLIFVGRLAENKGLGLFLSAVKKMNARAVIVGDGPLASSLKFKVKSEKLESKVTIHGYAKDSAEIARLLNHSKVLVMPSLNEGGPRVVLEAMACGVPVLATSVGIVPDVIKDKQSGRIIEWDSGDIAEKARILLNDPPAYAAYRAAGLEQVRQFERRSAIKNYADKLKSIIVDRS